ncbi:MULTISPECIES: ribonuclease III [Thioalkalivibrio]|uniref:Ribonuclease 3 n=1 Tax=Thioalkalivibrio halophilus TaxID=252474 RepID=A0A1V3A0B5_9GAMM|nr:MULTISPECIES: ribonuclease III [Thioalkalivibrio]OOC10775.1 ribonuclease III [Thioalkalivibrio halophilus]PYG04505.1 ribonuclease-3 [Thioalkalivibrio sp. ALE21]
MAERDFRTLLPEAVRDGEGMRQALTHRSAGGRNNERLEFLGDAVLGLVVADALYERLPDSPEGDLTRLRAALVNRESLAALARETGLEGTLNLGQGERKSGGQRRDSILADAVEALIGLTYREAGFDAARDFTLALYAERLENLPAAETLKDPKTRLQEKLQGRNAELPVYEVLEVSGPDHQRHFTVAVHLPTQGWGQHGRGSSRRRAEQAAAEAALHRLQQTQEQ